MPQDKSVDALNYVKMNGPSLPVKISKVIQTNILMASAVLSELVSSKKVKLTHENIGGSPLYYVDGQESKLQHMLGERFTGKKKDAYDLIKQKQVLQESKLEPAIRVALKEIKDFAVPLDVKFNNETHRFWKWYLIPENETKNLIENLITGKPKEIKEESKLEPKQEIKIKPPEIKPQKIEIKQETLAEPQEEIKPEEKIGFYKNVDSFFNENKVNIIKEEIIKRDREFNFIIEIPSNLGNLKYFVKVRNKKKISDADLSLAYSQAQMQQLPLLFLTNGEITKTAKKHLDTNLKGVVYKKF